MPNEEEPKLENEGETPAENAGEPQKDLKQSRKKLVWRIVGSVAFFLGCFALLFVCGACVYMLVNWDDVGLVEVITQLKMLDGTAARSVFWFCMSAVVAPLLLLSVPVMLYALWWRRPTQKKFPFYSAGALALIGIVVIGTITWNFLDVSGYIALSSQKTLLLDENYVDPYDEEDNPRVFFPAMKRNLVFLYLESTEVTFTDPAHGGIFEKNIIPELTALNESMGEDFGGTDPKLNGALSLPLTNWTTAGIFSTSAGLPCKIGLFETAIGNKVDFFGGVTSLGDLLETEGYDQTFYCGSAATFGGRALFLSGHGEFEFKDYEYYHSLPEEDPDHVDYDGWWGFNDQDLLRFMKEDLIEKSQTYVDEGRPFNMTAITVDSHFGDIFSGDGHLCDLCRDDPEYDRQYEKALHCDSKQVSEFVEWFYDPTNTEIDPLVKANTAFVLMGDHPSMAKNFADGAPKGYLRRTYASYINAAPVSAYDATARREYSSFDAFPTTLAALGCTIDGNRLGLGANLFSNEETLVEKYGFARLSADVQ
ncbi:MAG: LTA synthase family protein, partial [Bacilli bacterium]|nr:LTA synthase family protein [Bacilli bacterium]